MAKNKKYLVLGDDGCNGTRRYGVTRKLPKNAFERNKGEGLWELPDDDCGTLYVELRKNDKDRDEEDKEAKDDPWSDCNGSYGSFRREDGVYVPYKTVDGKQIVGRFENGGLPPFPSTGPGKVIFD